MILFLRVNYKFIYIIQLLSGLVQKKYNFTEKNKHIFCPIKYKIKGEIDWWTIDLKSALYFIIIILQT